MHERLKEAFGQVRAEDALKSGTKAFLFQKTNGYTKKKAINARHLLPAAACAMLLLTVGHWLYFTPTVEISIDINPSLELGVNRFDRVISVEGYNEDGEELARSLRVKYMDYSEAVSRILESDPIVALLSNEEIMTIVVTGTDGAQSSKVYSKIRSCTEGKNNTYCYHAHESEEEEAHEMGLSCGRYKAFLEAQALDPEITADDIQNMTMGEIQDLIDGLSGEDRGEKNGSGKSGHHRE